MQGIKKIILIMTLEEFNATLSFETPAPEISNHLKAMWYDAKGNWKMAHDIAQDISDKNGSWIHAYLHRKEGDNGNAGYWYRLAGKPVSSDSFETEWEELVKDFL